MIHKLVDQALNLSPTQCTELIFEQIGYAEINLNELNKKIDSKISRPYIIINTNYKHKNIFEFYYTDYNESNHRKINISEICPECEEYGYLNASYLIKWQYLILRE